MVNKSSLFKIIALLIIVVFAFFLRFNNIEKAPSGLMIDEAANAYNAYSIINTGKDEHGIFMPLIFKSFGDQKSPLYIYASVIPIKLLGLTPLGIRLISILCGTLLVIAIYFLLRELKQDFLMSLVGATIVAVSPWTVILSRLGWEMSLALLLFSSGLLFLLKALRTKKIIFYLLTGFFFALCCYTYIPYRAITLLIVIIIPFIYNFAYFKKYLFLLAVFAIIILPQIQNIFGTQGLTRFAQTNIFSDQGKVVTVNENRMFCTENQSRLLCDLTSNKFVEYSYTIVNTYSRITSFDFLFINGEGAAARFISVDKFGLFPLFLFPFYFLGFVYFFFNLKKLIKRKEIILLCSCLIIATFPIAITKDPIRSQMSALLPFITFIILFGYSNLFKLGFKFYKQVNYVLIVALLISGLIYSFVFVNVHAKKYYDNERVAQNISNYLYSQYPNVNEIYINPFYSEPLIYYAFYGKVNPREYQQTVLFSKPNQAGFQHALSLGKVKIFSGSYLDLACALKQNSQKILYATNLNIAVDEKNPLIKPVFTAKTENNALEVGYVYKLSDLITSQTDCSSRSTQIVPNY